MAESTIIYRDAEQKFHLYQTVNGQSAFLYERDGLVARAGNLRCAKDPNGYSIFYNGDYQLALSSDSYVWLYGIIFGQKGLIWEGKVTKL